MNNNRNKKWWQEAVVYQIYPKSFKDENGDGVGDLKGIIEKLDYIKELGANVIWLCPINCSPMIDNGYDISDYYKIDPIYGTNEDLEELVSQAGSRGLKVLMDLVVNHVSDQHNWFQEAVKNPQSPYRDYFIIRETKDGLPPNNFRSYFGGSVWERIGETNQFYFHAFAPQQPDLNWENKELRNEIFEMMCYWQEKGIAGFRIDAIGNIKKSEKILSCCHMEPDAEDGLKDSHEYILNQPGIEEFLGEMRDRVFLKYNSMTVAEVAVPEEDMEKYIGKNGFFSMVFDFSYADIDIEGITTPCDFAPWDLKKLKEYIWSSQLSYQKIGWAAPYLENHDQPRSLNKYLGEEQINFYSTTMLGALYFFLRGTPYIYQGQELGMVNYPFQSIEEFNDIGAFNKYKVGKALGNSEEKIMEFLRKRSRDHARTPMQWSEEEYAGFSREKPWLAVNPDYRERNVKKQINDPKSIFTFYRKMIWLRNQSEYAQTLIYGSFEPVEAKEDREFIYKRVSALQEVVVLINYSEDKLARSINLSGYEVLLNNYSDCNEDTYLPWQVLVAGRKKGECCNEKDR